jgi:hypothetical protein
MDRAAMVAASLPTVGMEAEAEAEAAQTATMRCRAVATAPTVEPTISALAPAREASITAQARLRERTEEEEGEDRLLRMPQVPPMEAPVQIGMRYMAPEEEGEATVAAPHQQVAAATPASTGQEEEVHAT